MEEKKKVSLCLYLLGHFRKLQFSILVGVEHLKHGVRVLNQLIFSHFLTLFGLLQQISKKVLRSAEYKER